MRSHAARAIAAVAVAWTGIGMIAFTANADLPIPVWVVKACSTLLIGVAACLLFLPAKPPKRSRGNRIKHT